MQLSKPMCIIVNKSISKGGVLSIYKKAKIIPQYIKGLTNDCWIYRPVSLLPSLSKILEKAVFQQMIFYLNKDQLLCEDQIGFRRRNQPSHVLQSMFNSIVVSSRKN